MINQILTTDEFKNFIENTRSANGYRDPIAFGIAKVDRGQKNAEKILQATFPVVNWMENYGSAAVFIAGLQEAGIKVDCAQS